ncbi:MAG: GIY-YIG nuclease family protein [Candidatus Pacearchaeota archaeon]
MVRGKTINIYLPDGNPKGVKICEIPNSIIKAIQIPRNLIKEAQDYENLEKVGIYFLFSEKDESSQFKTYIGEAEDIKKRIKQHDSPNKDYWNYAVCFVSGKDNLNKAHVKFLESFCHEEAEKSKRTDLMNNCSPTRSSLSPSEKDFSLQFFDEIKLILGTLGYPIFEKIKKAEREEDIFYCKGKDAEAKGNLTEEGFVVYEGSKARLDDVASLNYAIKEYKEALKRNDILKEVDNKLIFDEDLLMSSPSNAAAVVLGRPANGWLEWKNKDGKTLDKLKRQKE